MLEVTTNHYLVLSAVLFSIGLVGILTRRNMITVLMSIELILNSVNINLIAFSYQHSDLTGQIFAVFTIAVAAGVGELAELEQIERTELQAHDSAHQRARSSVRQ